MTYLGALFLLVSSFLIGKSYSAYLERGCSELEGFLDFVKHIRSRVSVYAEPISGVRDRFYDERLVSCGFIDRLRESRSLREAYEGVRDNLSIGDDAKEVLDGFFSSVGHAYIDSEVKNLDYTVESLTEIAKVRRSEIAGKRRALKASVYALALGIVVLVI